MKETLSAFISRTMSECEAEGRSVFDWELRKMYDEAHALEIDLFNLAQVVLWLKEWRVRLGLNEQVSHLSLAAFDAIISVVGKRP